MKQKEAMAKMNHYGVGAFATLVFASHLFSRILLS